MSCETLAFKYISTVNLFKITNHSNSIFKSEIMRILMIIFVVVFFFLIFNEQPYLCFKET